MHLPPLGLHLFALVSLGTEERGQVIIWFFFFYRGKYKTIPHLSYSNLMMTLEESRHSEPGVRMTFVIICHSRCAAAGCIPGVVPWQDLLGHPCTLLPAEMLRQQSSTLTPQPASPTEVLCTQGKQGEEIGKHYLLQMYILLFLLLCFSLSKGIF